MASYKIRRIFHNCLYNTNTVLYFFFSQKIQLFISKDKSFWFVFINSHQRGKAVKVFSSSNKDIFIYPKSWRSPLIKCRRTSSKAQLLVNQADKQPTLQPTESTDPHLGNNDYKQSPSIQLSSILITYITLKNRTFLSLLETLAPQWWLLWSTYACEVIITWIRSRIQSPNTAQGCNIW